MEKKPRALSNMNGPARAYPNRGCLSGRLGDADDGSEVIQKLMSAPVLSSDDMLTISADGPSPCRPSRHFWHNPPMCGRFRLSWRKQIVIERFDATSDEPEWEPRYNIAPTQLAAVVRQHLTEPIRKLSMLRWGLIPAWAKDSSTAASMINARSETADTKPAFSDALKRRRCLIPADGFYEWKRSGASKQPFCFEVNDAELFALAGLR